MSSGPPTSSIKWRRTIDVHSGEFIFEGPLIDEEASQEGFHIEAPRDCITELWHSTYMIPPAFQSHDDAVEEVDEGWDGSQENLLPGF